MTPAERAEKRAAWLLRIRREIERRQAPTLGVAGGDVRKAFLEELREIGQRLRSVPDWCEPSASEQRREGEKLARLVRRLGYGRDRGE